MYDNFVGVDLGASSTRYVSDTGEISIVANNMVIIEPETVVDMEPYSDEIESALDISIECDNGCEHFPVRVLVGQMAERYSANNIKPSTMQNKNTQRITYISAILATALSKYKQSCKNGTAVDGDVGLYIALPPVEAKTAKDTVREKLIGTYTVTFHKLNNYKMKFTVKDVEVYEESFMALLSYFFEMDGKPRNTKYVQGNVLSLDIGASTTDLAVVQNMRYLEKSGQTYKTGGNIARDSLADYIRAEYGFDAPIEMAELAIAEGRIQFGNTYRDCSEAVDRAKRALAEQVVTQIQEYFRRVNIPIQTIRAIIVSGGGSMEGQYIDESGNIVKTSRPTGDFICEELAKVCPGVDVEQNHNPRLANIQGLFVRAKLDMMAKKREAQSE